MSNWNINRRNISILAGLSAVSLLCWVVYQVVFVGCFWWECAPKRSFGVLDLNLPTHLFPPTSQIHNLEFLRNDLSTDPAVGSVQWKDGSASYSVWKFPTNSKAIIEYQFQVDSRIFTEPLTPGASELNILAYQSSSADESNIQCGYVIRDVKCRFVARYQEFTITFSSTIDSNHMSNKRYLEVVSYIDSQMARLLRKDS